MKLWYDILPRHWPFVMGIHWKPPDGFPSQRPVTWSFDVLFVICLKKRSNKKTVLTAIQDAMTVMWPHCNVFFRQWLDTARYQTKSLQLVTYKQSEIWEYLSEKYANIFSKKMYLKMASTWFFPINSSLNVLKPLAVSKSNKAIEGAH